MWRVHEVEPDGNCFFHAVGFHTGETAAEVRSRVCDHTGKFCKPGQWVDTQEGDIIGALVEIYKRPVLVVTARHTEIYTSDSFEICGDSSSHSVHTLGPIIIKSSGCHFLALSYG